MTLVRDVGEQGVLQKLKAFCPSDVIGDDGAILALKSSESLVVTTDVLVENIHFSDRTTAPEDIGWRAVAANLSDLAAMGATPVGLTVGLSLHGEVSLDWLDRLYQGLTACTSTYQTAIVGGDVCRSPVVSLAITAFGQVAPQRAIRRHTASPGNAIVVTGDHGSARAGLELLLQDEIPQDLTPEQRQTLIDAHQRPRPRLDVLAPLYALLGQQGCAGMDSSDGLADAVIQVCRESNVGASLKAEAIPIAPELRSWVGVERALDWALYGGEDFELLLCLPPDMAAELVQQIGGNAAIVGTIAGDRAVQLQTGDDWQTLSQQSGFQHF